MKLGIKVAPLLSKETCKKFNLLKRIKIDEIEATDNIINKNTDFFQGIGKTKNKECKFKLKR